jgi:NitT/TauT family transport system substrate-binding protein
MMNFRSLTVLGCLFAACVASQAIAEPAKVAIGYTVANEFLPVFVAKEKGFFAKHDIDATPIRIPVITNIPSAIVSDSLQIGATTATILMQAVDGGLDFVLIAGAAHNTKANPFISLVARKDLKIEKPADIVGKKVGVSGINSVLDVFFRKWLINNKVPVDQVKIIEARIPEMPDLLKSGTLDLVTIIEPLRTRIITGGIGYVVADYVSEVDPDMLLGAWMASGDWAKKNPQVVKNFRTAIDEGLAFIKENPQEARDIEKKYLGFIAPSFPTFENKVKPNDLKVFISIGKELGLYHTALDPAKLVFP